MQRLRFTSESLLRGVWFHLECYGGRAHASDMMPLFKLPLTNQVEKTDDVTERFENPANGGVGGVIQRKTEMNKQKAKRQKPLVKFKERRAGSHVLDVHGFLRPAVRVQGEGVVIGTVDVRQHKCLLVFGLRVQGGYVVFVRVVDKLAEREAEGSVVT